MDKYIAIDKSSIEDKIKHWTKVLKQAAKDRSDEGKTLFIKCAAKISLLEILKREAIEIPVEESWDVIEDKQWEEMMGNVEGKRYDTTETTWGHQNYPNGVIIKSNK